MKKQKTKIAKRSAEDRENARREKALVGLLIGAADKVRVTASWNELNVGYLKKKTE